MFEYMENEILSWQFNQVFENEDLEDGPPIRENGMWFRW